MRRKKRKKKKKLSSMLFVETWFENYNTTDVIHGNQINREKS